MLAHNVSQEELKEGKTSYNAISRTYDEGRIAINKNNILKLIYSFWETHLKPLPVPDDHLLRFMLESGHYIPAPVWCYSSQGKGLDKAKFKAMWSLVRDGVERATIYQVRQIFLKYKNSDLDLVEDALWSGPLRVALDTARGLRAANEASGHHVAPSNANLVPPQGQQDIFPETEPQQEEPALEQLLNELEELQEDEDNVDVGETYDSE